MRTQPLFPLALVALAAVAYACIADPELQRGGRGDGPASLTAPEDGFPGLVAPPVGGLALLADTTCTETGQDSINPTHEPCELDGFRVPGEDPCPGYGEVYDPDTDDCQCREGFERDGNGYCGFDWPDPPNIGGPRTDPLGGGGDDDGDDDDTEEEERLEIELTCTPGTVTRVRSVSCVATSDNAIGTTSYEWLFRPKDGGVRIWDHGPPQGLSAIQGGADVGAKWAGPMVAGGKVSVIVLDSTRFASTAAEVSVTPRSGNRWTVENRGFARGPDLKEYIIPAGGDVGLNTNTFGSGYPFHILEGWAMLGSVESGPNKGYGYVASQSYFIDRQWRINERLTSSGPAEVPYVKPNGDTVIVNHWTYLVNKGRNPQPARTGVQAHESYGQNGAKGHQGQIEKALNTSTCKDAGGLLERVVADNPSDASRIMDDIRVKGNEAFAYSTWHNYVHSNFTGDIVLYDPNGTKPPFIYTLTDSATGPYPVSPGDRCRWRGVF